MALVLLLPSWGLQPEVLALTVPYLKVITWSLLPLLLYASFRRYLQALGIVVPITVALVTANVINAVAAWALVYGHFGLPRDGHDRFGRRRRSCRASTSRPRCSWSVVSYDRRHHISLFSVAWKPKRKSLRGCCGSASRRPRR